jgi:ribosomal 30S subunit maturation factor RimM
MIAVENIQDWRGCEIRDPAGESVGKLHEVYFDVDTGTPILFAIKSGLLGRHAKMIPADDAVVGPSYVRVTHDKATIENSPDADKEEPPDAVELDEIGKAYGLRFSDKVRLESATAADDRRAEAAEAHRRAEELEAEAREKAAALQSAQSRSEGASTDAQQAEREAEEAREAARRARLEADRHPNS